MFSLFLIFKVKTYESKYQWPIEAVTLFGSHCFQQCKYSVGFWKTLIPLSSISLLLHLMNHPDSLWLPYILLSWNQSIKMLVVLCVYSGMSEWHLYGTFETFHVQNQMSSALCSFLKKIICLWLCIQFIVLSCYDKLSLFFIFSFVFIYKVFFIIIIHYSSDVSPQ